MKVTIDHKTHIYTVEGFGHPKSVTQVIGIFFPPCPFWKKEHAEIGSLRHMWYSAIITGQEIENTPDPRIAAEIEGFRKFLREVRPEYILGEVPMFDPRRMVCGTPDLYCKIGGRLAVVDYKPKGDDARYRVQTQAYATMLIENGYPVLDRYAVRVYPNDYRLDFHEDPHDADAWEAFVYAAHCLGHYK